MQAGFAKLDMTPPPGTRLMGWGAPSQRLMTAAHDPLHVRALAVSDEAGHEAVIVAMDLCFIGREDSDRILGRIARELGLMPHQVMLAATHTHAGPDVGNYYEAFYLPPQRDYLALLDDTVVQAIRVARERRRPVRLRAGRGRTTLPMNRRPLDAQGKNSAGNAPAPGGPVQDDLPLCLLEDAATGKPVCLLYSIGTHPVCFSGTEASADYIGVACDLLDQHLGAACSLFLQGCAGDSRPRTLADGNRWAVNPGESQTVQTGTILAQETRAALATLQPLADGPVRSALVEVRLPLQPPLPVSQYEAALKASNPIRVAWGRRQLTLLERGRIARHAPLLLQALQLGADLRLCAIEGEPLHPYAARMRSAWPGQLVFPLGYISGEGVYLVTTPMLDEGGYEPGSFWEYNYPSPLAPGMEHVIDAGLAELRRKLA